MRAFKRGSQALAEGHYDTRIPVESDDELGQLARDFNTLAVALERTEAQRRQWVADTSHELRTPISVLRYTDNGGQARITMQVDQNSSDLEIHFEDSKPGVGSADGSYLPGQPHRF